MKKYKHQIGKSKENLYIEVTTFDGKSSVMVITPKKPTEKQKQETIDFILHELDDHDGYDKYLEELEK